jgi:hypothetical protein
MNHSLRTPSTNVDYRTLVCVKVKILSTVVAATEANITVV